MARQRAAWFSARSRSGVRRYAIGHMLPETNCGPTEARPGQWRLKAKKMKLDELQELGRMAANLEDTARKLPPGLKQGKLLQDIERFRAQLNAQISKLKAKGK